MSKFSLRPRAYPSETVICGERYVFDRILKDDFFSVNVLYRNAQGRRYVLKLSDFRFLCGVLLRPLAALISQHEYRIYQRLADIPGIPALGPRFGWRGYFHRFIEGRTLYEHSPDTPLPGDFFDQLAATLRAIHARRIWYVDLNKRGNIIVSDEGRAYLIDFQICVHFKQYGGWWGNRWDGLFHRLIQEDVYHLYKHKKAFQPDAMTAEELRLATRSALNRRYGRFLWRPYVTIKRLFYPHGSNEMIWYKWKRLKNRMRPIP